MGLSISQLRHERLLDERCRWTPPGVVPGSTGCAGAPGYWSDAASCLLPDESEIPLPRQLDTLPKLEYDGDATVQMRRRGVKIGARVGPYELIHAWVLGYGEGGWSAGRTARSSGRSH